MIASNNRMACNNLSDANHDNGHDLPCGCAVIRDSQNRIVIFCRLNCLPGCDGDYPARLDCPSRPEALQ